VLEPMLPKTPLATWSSLQCWCSVE